MVRGKVVALIYPSREKFCDRSNLEGKMCAEPFEMNSFIGRMPNLKL